MTAALLTLIFIREAVIVNKTLRAGTGEVVDSINASATIVTRI